MIQSVGTILKGVCAGAFSGLLLVLYICVLTSQHVIQRADYTHPSFYENAEGRYKTAVILSFVLVFSVVGPFVAAASYGRWLRHAVYGLVGCLAIIVAVALIGAAINNEHPFNIYKGAEGFFTDAARIYGILASFVIGPLAGIMIGRYRNKRRETDTHQAVPEV